ncbi:MAG: HlyC/CorC family transporter [Anaerolineae bacterium]|jgi:putative hemolysin|nr:HlyC/CorC family transporter [Anaerolineae bacterium]MBT7601627.1 HlyC/CorC family transporter [Anaerolineae bacterium]MBT7988796.1 HlyC/CorC family transporter [Anaerolineae bacterium]
MLSDFLFIMILILANGLFAASEMALVSARSARLQTKANDGDTRALSALRLQSKPAEFLATVQVGITLVGTLASAVGGLEAAKRIGPQIAQIPLFAQYAEEIALGLVVAAISFASLLFGELVPKRLALRNPERFSISVVGFMGFLTKIFKLPVQVLIKSADLVMRLFGDENTDGESISPEEIEVLVHRGAAEGEILPVQARMIERIFDYADRSTVDEMTPRVEMITLKAKTTITEALEIAKEYGFSRYPVIQQDTDDILGYVHIKDLIWAAPKSHLTDHLRPIVFIPDGVTLPKAFTTLTRAGQQMAIIMDEYGGTKGLLTLENILEVIVGEIEDEHSPVTTISKQASDGEWRIVGNEPIANLSELLGVDFAPHGAYRTIAGFIINELENMPKEGESVIYSGYRFLVEEVEQFRIISVRVSPERRHPFE